MPHVLTKKELDSLLRPIPHRSTEGHGDERARAKASAPDRGPAADPATGDPRNVLEALAPRFCEFASGLSRALSSRLNDTVRVEFRSVRMQDLGGFSSRLEGPTCVSPFMIEHTGAMGMVGLALPLAFFIAERLLGRHGPVADPPRPLAEVEGDLVKGVLRLCLDALEGAWPPAEPMALTLGPPEGLPPDAPPLVATSPVIVAVFTVAAFGTTETLHLALPATA